MTGRRIASSFSALGRRVVCWAPQRWRRWGTEGKRNLMGLGSLHRERSCYYCSRRCLPCAESPQSGGESRVQHSSPVAPTLWEQPLGSCSFPPSPEMLLGAGLHPVALHPVLNLPHKLPEGWEGAAPLHCGVPLPWQRLRGAGERGLILEAPHSPCPSYVLMTRVDLCSGDSSCQTSCWGIIGSWWNWKQPPERFKAGYGRTDSPVKFCFDAHVKAMGLLRF